MSSRQRTRSRTASSRSSRTWMAVSSPARHRRTSFAASRRSVLIRWPRAARRQRGRDDRTGDAKRDELTVEIVAGDSGFVACRHRAFALKPLEEATDLSRIVRDLAELGLRVARSQDPHYDLPLAVIERDVGSILLHDRPPIACGSVPARNNPRLCDMAGRSFHIV